MDMHSRRLPPPLVLYSDNEKDAWIKNRNEQSRLDKVLDHLNIQEHVYGQIFDKEASVVKTRSNKFQERAKAATAAMVAGKDGEKEEEEEEEEKSRDLVSAGSRLKGSSRGSGDCYSYQIETKQGMIRKTVAKPGVAWGEEAGKRGKIILY